MNLVKALTCLRFWAFSPERIDPGDPVYNVRNTPKVVGGAGHLCTEAAAAPSATAMDRVVPVSRMRTAEIARLVENTLRSANIGLVNEMALMCDKLHADQVNMNIPRGIRNMITGHARLIVDSRNALGGDSTGQAKVVKL